MAWIEWGTSERERSVERYIPMLERETEGGREGNNPFYSEKQTPNL